MDIGTFLKLSRQDRELTQKEVAEAVGVSEGTVSRWESGKIGNMRRDKIEALAKVLDIDPVVITQGKYEAVLENASAPIPKIKKLFTPISWPEDNICVQPFQLFMQQDKVFGADSAKEAALVGIRAGLAKATKTEKAGLVTPAATALANLASAATTFCKLMESSPDADNILSSAEFTKEERQMIEDYRTLSDSDKQTIQLMLRSLKEKHTVTTNIDGNSEEG